MPGIHGMPHMLQLQHPQFPIRANPIDIYGENFWKKNLLQVIIEPY